MCPARLAQRDATLSPARLETAKDAMVKTACLKQLAPITSSWQRGFVEKYKAREEVLVLCLII